MNLKQLKLLIRDSYIDFSKINRRSGSITLEPNKVYVLGVAKDEHNYDNAEIYYLTKTGVDGEMVKYDSNPEKLRTTFDIMSGR